MKTLEISDKERRQLVSVHLQNQQSLPVALVAGIGAAIVSAIIWAAITIVTEYQIGWMAVGVGVLVGLAVRCGKGVDRVYSVVGAALALIGCILGNFFSIVGFVAKQEQMNVFSILGAIDYLKVPSVMIEASSPMDLLFYGIAMYEGYKLSVRSITADEAESAQEAA